MLTSLVGTAGRQPRLLGKVSAYLANSCYGTGWHGRCCAARMDAYGPCALGSGQIVVASGQGVGACQGESWEMWVHVFSSLLHGKCNMACSFLAAAGPHSQCFQREFTQKYLLNAYRFVPGQCSDGPKPDLERCTWMDLLLKAPVEMILKMRRQWVRHRSCYIR